MLSDTLKSNCNSYNTVLNFFIIFFFGQRFVYLQEVRKKTGREKVHKTPLLYSCAYRDEIKDHFKGICQYL